MNILASVIIFIVLYQVGKWQRKRHWRYFVILTTAPMKADMDKLKLEISERLLSVIKTCWRDAMVLTEAGILDHH